MMATRPAIRMPEPAGLPRVLIVDDEPHIRTVLRRALPDGAYEVAEAGDGAEAIELLEEAGADVILSDLLMPVVGGIELLSQAKAIDETVGFIILTGAATLENAIEALRLQVDDYLLKPFNLDEVAMSVERSLRQRQLVRENRFYQRQLERRVIEQDQQIENIFVDALLSLANAIEARDGYTGGHVERVTRYAVATGVEVGLDDDGLQRLWVAGLLHDVGKIGVPDHILKKPGPLTSKEYEVMKQHPAIGATILERSSFLRPALPGVLHHQERWDGTGYPGGLAGEAISIEGRILAVADTFDAIVSSRPYRHQQTEREAIAELRRCAGTQFDPEVVESFVRCYEDGFPRYPGIPTFRG